MKQKEGDGFIVSAYERMASRPWLPALILFLVPLIAHLPLLFSGLSVNPLLINSFAVLGGHLGILPGVPYLDPNAGFTTQALGHFAALDWLHGVIPWWNPYSGIGLPLAGGMASSSFFLPFLFLVLLTNGVLWLKIALQIVAGWATYALLRELKLGRLASLVGGIIFSLNGTFAWFSYVAMNPIPFLPLLLYGIERARSQEKSSSGVFWIGVAIAWSLFAGFPETAYIDGLLALLWTAYRFARTPQHWRFAGRVMRGGVLGLLLAAPLLIAFADYLHVSNAIALYTYDRSLLPGMAFATLFMPYVYGPLASGFGNQDIRIMWGNIGGYGGVILIFMSLYALSHFWNKKEKGLRLLLFSWVLMSWAKSFGLSLISSPLNHLPFSHQTAFFRYSPPSWELALAILAAFALEDLKDGDLNFSGPLMISLGFVVFSAWLAWPGRIVAIGGAAALKISFLVSIFWALGCLLLCAVAGAFFRGEVRRIIFFTLLIAEAFVFFAPPELSGIRSVSVDWPAIVFLKNRLGLSRFYTFSPIAPNYGSYFRIRQINYNTVPVAANWADFIRQKLFPPLQKSLDEIYLPDWPPYGINMGRRYLFQFLGNYEKIGVRYVLTRSDRGLGSASFAFAANRVTDPLPLFAGQSLKAKLRIPSIKGVENKIDDIGVFQGNFGGSADGRVLARLCTKFSCVEGVVPLKGSRDDSFLHIPLSRPLLVRAGDRIRMTIFHKGGHRPFAVWLRPAPPNLNLHLRGPSGDIPGKALNLILRYAVNLEGIRKVYSDPLMDIWELPHPKPYYSVLGGPCVLSQARRQSVDTDCARPARLIRRELYMPGWRARINGVFSRVNPYDQIMESIRLPIGENAVRFNFIPPYAGVGWVAFWIGWIALFYEGLSSLRYFFRRGRVGDGF